MRFGELGAYVLAFSLSFFQVCDLAHLEVQFGLLRFDVLHHRVQLRRVRCRCVVAVKLGQLVLQVPQARHRLLGHVPVFIREHAPPFSEVVDAGVDPVDALSVGLALQTLLQSGDHALPFGDLRP